MISQLHHDFAASEAQFVAGMERIATGYSRANPLLITAKLYIELASEPAIHHLMPAFKPDNPDVIRCLGKTPFADRQQARRVAMRKDGKSRQAYRCACCDKWHLMSVGGKR